MNYSHPFLIKLRFILGRKLGVLRPLTRLYRYIRRADYEASFNKALLSSIHPGWTVWDVGANEGFYTQKFSELVGNGRVIAFEPSPQTFEKLKQLFSSTANVQVENVALGRAEGMMSFFVSKNSTRDSLFRPEGEISEEVVVEVKTADSYSGVTPDVIKIDVEGYELDVLYGMSSMLASRRLKHLFVEVHFSILAARGYPDAPAAIVRLLKAADMSVDWLDPSHLKASRKS